jgi:hypothetical protein
VVEDLLLETGTVMTRVMSTDPCRTAFQKLSTSSNMQNQNLPKSMLPINGPNLFMDKKSDSLSMTMASETCLSSAALTT